MNFHFIILATIVVTITNALPNKKEIKSRIGKGKRSYEYDGDLEIPYGDGRVISIDQFIGSIIINVYSNEANILIPTEDYETTTTESPRSYCPSTLFGNQCMSYGCTSNSSCSFNEMCCNTDGIGTSCCKSLNWISTRPSGNPWTISDRNVWLDGCPTEPFSRICTSYGCTSNSSCSINEMCCITGADTCCRSSFPITHTPTPEADMCPPDILHNRCLSGGCISSSSCLFQEICCYEMEGSCCKSIYPETTSSTTEDYETTTTEIPEMCPQDILYNSCQGSCSSSSHCSALELCCYDGADSFSCCRSIFPEQTTTTPERTTTPSPFT